MQPTVKLDRTLVTVLVDEVVHIPITWHGYCENSPPPSSTSAGALHPAPLLPHEWPPAQARPSAKANSACSSRR
jgi:hypothetical protein